MSPISLDYFKAVNVNPKSLIILRSNDLKYLEEAENVLAKHFHGTNRHPFVFQSNDRIKDHVETNCQFKKSSGDANKGRKANRKTLHYDLDFLLSFQNKQYDLATETRNLTKHLRIQRDDYLLVELEVGDNGQKSATNGETIDNQQNGYLRVPDGQRRNHRLTVNADRNSLENAGKVSTDADTGEYRYRRSTQANADEHSDRQSNTNSRAGSFGNADKASIEANAGEYRRRRQPYPTGGLADEHSSKQQTYNYDNRPVRSVASSDEKLVENGLCDDTRSKPKQDAKPDIEPQSRRRDQADREEREQADRSEAASAGRRRSMSGQGQRTENESERAAGEPTKKEEGRRTCTGKPQRRVTGGINEFGNVSFDVRDLM